ncbi:MAG: hypothetical protein LBL08_00355 [Candidatus Nomurabacteria bacterium]|jgi:pyruvate,water dikinase|nr:hypothetical protein [Candidatus Nomurabacteria bacterium]
MTKRQVTILDDSNIVESYPGITLPLTESFIKAAYHEIFRGALLRLTSSQKIVKENDESLQNMLASYNGRIYYQINNWYSVIRYMPFSHKIIPIWQEMMGVNHKSDSTDQKHAVPFSRKMIIAKNVASGTFGTPREMAKLNQVFADAEKYFNTDYNANLANEQLKELYETLFKKVLLKWDVTLANDLYAFVFTGLVKRRLKNANQYISSAGNIESMKPLRALLDIVKFAVESKEIEKMAKLKTNDDADNFLASKTELAGKINRYIAKFGDRYLDELKLESPTYRTAPKLLIDRIMEYAETHAELDAVAGNGTLAKPKSSRLTKKFLDMAIVGIKNREASRLNRARLYGMVRTIFLTIGKNMARDKIILSQADIFYLTISEIFDYIDGQEIDLAKIIKNRQKDYRTYEHSPAQHRLVFIDGKLQNDSNELLATNELLGVPVSSGKATAEVVVVQDPKSVSDISGKILVTRTTDPAWAFLLVKAAGVIAEKGSLLSHTAIIARELNVPAIVNIPNVTSLLKNGDIVTMDCATGKVEIQND